LISPGELKQQAVNIYTVTHTAGWKGKTARIYETGIAGVYFLYNCSITYRRHTEIKIIISTRSHTSGNGPRASVNTRSITVVGSVTVL